MLSRRRYCSVSLLYVLFMTISVTGGINNSYSEYDSSTSSADRNINCKHHKILKRTLIACEKYSSKCCLEVGHCMTHDNATQSALIGKCPYHLHDKTIKDRVYIELNTNYSNLNNFMCGGSLERNGTLCGKCRNGYGPAVFAQDATCYPCSGHYHGWALYIFFELFFITIFFLSVIFLHISATSESMNAFVFFCQFMVAFVSYGSPVYEYSLRHVPMVLVKILLTVYGFWNLDFFRQVLPPFCVSAEINNLDSLSLQYIAAVYPLCLIFVTYFCIELHGRNFRPVVCCWAPIHWCYARCRRTWNPQSSIVHVIATFLLLSYSKLILVSTNLINYIAISNITHLKTTFNVTREPKTVLYFEPSIEPFSAAHLRYAIPAVIVLSTFVLIPPLILILYPTKLFQKCLGCCNQRWHALHTFVDAFQGCYKDGTNGTRDCRYFAGVYLLLRIILLLLNAITLPLGLVWILPGILFTIFSWCFATFRPYKVKIFNVVDSTLMSLFGVAAFLAAFVTYAEDRKYREVIIIIIYSITAVPLLYIVLYVAYVLFSKVKPTTTLEQQRRRSYADIENSDNEMDGAARVNWEMFPDRVLNPNSYGTV